MEKQFTCEHKNTTGKRYPGFDSHSDWYENKCDECGLILEAKSV